MSNNTDAAVPPAAFSDCVARIAAACEYMLAYASEGRDGDAAGGDPPIRIRLVELEYGLMHLTSASRMKMAGLQAPVEALQALEAFSDRLEADVERALNVLQVALTAPTLSSQLIGRLSESTHLRCVLGDVNLLDEALQMHQRAGLQKA